MCFRIHKCAILAQAIPIINFAPRSLQPLVQQPEQRKEQVEIAEKLEFGCGRGELGVQDHSAFRQSGGPTPQGFFTHPNPHSYKKQRHVFVPSGIYASLRPEHEGGSRPDPHVLAAGRQLLGGTYYHPGVPPRLAGEAPGGETHGSFKPTPPPRAGEAPEETC